MSDFARQLEVFGDCGEMSRAAVRPALFKAAARIRAQRDLLDECDRLLSILMKNSYGDGLSDLDRQNIRHTLAKLRAAQEQADE